MASQNTPKMIKETTKTIALKRDTELKNANGEIITLPAGSIVNYDRQVEREGVYHSVCIWINNRRYWAVKKQPHKM